jgi:DNA invertase Pin-like site-specific DNA recombinase
MKRAVLYLRVSTLDQTTANQERELRDVAGRMGCDIVKVYKDHGISGAKGREKRPAFDALCRDAAQRKFDVVMAWSVDRLGRSLQDLVAFLSELHALRIDLFLHQQGLDTTTPAGKAMFQMMGVFAEFERAIIQERVRAGLARAKSEGKRLGRPPIAPELENRIRAALGKPGRTEGVRKIAAQFGVDPGTVQRISRPFVEGASVGV